MRITRQKQIRRLLRWFRLNYGFNEPYNVILDGNFLVAALRIEPNTEDLISKLLNRRRVRSFTSRCIKNELRTFGDEFRTALEVSKHMRMVDECDHENGTESKECIVDVVSGGNPGHFFVATQDFKLRARLKNIPGVPLIFIDKGIPQIDMTYKASVRDTSERYEEKTAVTKSDIDLLKEEYGMETASKGIKAKRKRTLKGPNPLSMKKRVAKPGTAPNPEKKKRTRTKRVKRDPDIVT